MTVIQVKANRREYEQGRAWELWGQNREILWLLGLQDLVTLWLWGGNSQGSAWAGWQGCIALYQNKSTRRKTRFGGDKGNLVFYLVEFLVTTRDIWELIPGHWSPRHIWPYLSFWLHLVPFSRWICALLPRWLFQSSGFWAVLVSRILKTFLLCARHCGLSLFTPASTPWPSSSLLRPQVLAFMSFSQGSLPWLPHPLSQIRSTFVLKTPHTSS